MFQFSRMYRQLFLDYRPDFIEEDVDFDGTYADDWLAAIEDSELQETAETRDDRSEGETTDVIAAMSAGRKAYIQLRRFIKKAFTEKPSVLNEFGLDNYKDIGSSQSRMAAFLTNYHNLAENKYKTELLAVNCSQAKIDAVLTAKNDLTREDTEQNVFVKTEPIDTAKRKQIHNKTYGFTQFVNEASKSRYYDDILLLNLFLLPRSHEPDADIFNLTGTASDSATASPLEGLSVLLQELDIIRTTDENGQYGFGNIPSGTYTLVFSLAGYVTQTLTVTIPDDGTVNIFDVAMVANP